MRTFKGNLTRITTRITEKLPAEGDLYGYPGVTRELLVKTCKEIHALAGDIETHDTGPNIEIITLKRTGSKVMDSLSDFLENGADSPKAKDKFDDFVSGLSKLYEKTKMVYFITTKGALRDEIELLALQDRVVKVSGSLKTYEELAGKVGTALGNATALQGEVQTSLKTATEAIEALSARAEKATKAAEKAEAASNGFQEEIEAVHTQVGTWKSEVETCQATVKSTTKTLGENAQQIAAHEKTFNELAAKAKDLQEQSEALTEQNKALLTQVKDTLAGADRAGMAASFQEMKDEMGLAQAKWEKYFFGSLLGLSAAVTTLLVLGVTGKLQPTVSGYILRITFLSPFVWMAWFCARRHGIINRVREDYAFKYAASRAYEGYKKAATESGDDMAQQLIRLSIGNIAENPIRLYADGHKEHASPLTEAWDKALETVGLVRSARVKTTPQGVEAEVVSGAARQE